MLLRQTQLYLPAQIGAPLVQLASVLVWAHVLPAGELGRLMLVFALQDILFAAFFVWWSHFALRYLPGFILSGQIDSFRQSESIALVLSSLAQTIVVAVISLVYFPTSTPLFLFAVVAFATVKAWNNYGSEKARAEQQILSYTLIQVVLPTVGLLLSIVSIDRVGDRAEIVLLALAASMLVTVRNISVSLDFIRADRVDRRMLRQAAAFGFPAMLAALLSACALNLPRFVVDMSLGHASAGVFAVAFGLGVRISTFAVMLVTAGAYPLAVRRMEAEGMAAGLRQLSANLVLVWAVAIPMALALAGLSGSVVELFLPSEMQQTAAVILPLATLAGLFRYLRAHTTDQVFLIASNPRPIVMIVSLELFLTVVLTGLSVTYVGLDGAAFGPLGATAISAVMGISWAIMGYGFRFPVGAVGRIALASFGMWAALLMMNGAASWGGLALLIAAATTLYLLLAAILFPGVATALIRQIWLQSANRFSQRGNP